MKRTIAAPQFAHYPDDWHFSPVLMSGDFAFLSGQTGTHPDGTISLDPEQQFRDAFSFLTANLAAAGLGFDDVVEMTTYHVGLRDHFDLFDAIRLECFSEPYPAWTAVEVAGLRREGAIVEIRVIASNDSSG